jgi:Domain of unknown function (DUF2017)
MARGFRRTRHGYRCRLEREEAFLLHRLAVEVDALIEAEAGDPPQPADRLEAMVAVAPDAQRPDDPVVARLFPDAYADEQEAAEFRRYTLPELSAGKRAGLATLRRTIPDAGGDVTLDEETAQAWLTALNDLRLALGTRLGVTEDVLDEPPEDALDDTLALLFDAYDLLTYLQGTLVEAVAGW